MTLCCLAMRWNWTGSEDNIPRELEVKTRGRLGSGENDQKSVRILNRIITWNKDEIQFEADQRHAEIIVKQLGLKGSSNAMRTPRVKSADDT